MTRPIFICGTGRCGTSWLQSILRHHGRIFSMTGESLFAVTPGGLFDIQREMLSLPAVQRFRERMLGPWFHRVVHAGTPREYEAGLFHDFTREELTYVLSKFDQQLRDGTNAAMGELMNGIFTTGMMKHPAKHRWLEKTPRNVIYIDELHQLFPDAQFLHIIRDGRDVALSLVENFWPIGENPKENVSFRELPRNVRNAARYWRYFLEVGCVSGAKLPPQKYMEIRYEDLIDSLSETLQRICGFLGEPFEPEILRFRPKADRRGRWREVFTELDKAAFKEEANDMLVRMGYEKDANW